VTDLYPPITRWMIPAAARAATLSGLRRAGQRGHEGGALWLGDRGVEARVRTVASASGDGVLERAGSWSLSPTAYGRIGEWAIERGQVLLGLIHSHGGSGALATSLSPTDAFSTVRVHHFLSVIVGRRGDEDDASAWGYHLFEQGRFRRLGAAEVAERIVWTSATIDHLQFDETTVEAARA
jgi:hypothetical protein